MLDHPSLAELLPSGVFIASDDYSHRTVAIDLATGALVWHNGITGKPGTALGGTKHPGRLRPAAADRINADAPYDRMKPAGHRHRSMLRTNSPAAAD